MTRPGSLKRCCVDAMYTTVDQCGCGRPVDPARRELFLRLQKPSPLWHGDTPVIPLDAFKKLPGDVRRVLLRDVNAALSAAIKKGPADG